MNPTYSVQSIGIIRTPYHQPQDMPIQASEDPHVHGTAIIDPPWHEGLADLTGFDRVWLLWWAHRGRPAVPLVTPFRDTQPRGVFATRVPIRPNPIAMSCVRLVSVGPDRIRFEGVDMLDGTPLLDIKPYVPVWDAFPGIRSGWYDRAGRPDGLSDPRFLADHPSDPLR